jgi:hypothetical protein
MCLFSVASSFIVISYLIVGWMFCDKNDRENSSNCCRTRGYAISSMITLFISGFGFITFIDLKIYERLKSISLNIPWAIASMPLIISHGIILTYYSYIKGSYVICDGFDCSRKRKVAYGIKPLSICFIGWDRCLYFILELLTLLRLDDILGEVNWLLILIPAYITFIIRFILEILCNHDLSTW